MKKLIYLVLLFFFCFNCTNINSSNPELVIGQERLTPGIIFIFEGAIKDKIFPNEIHLSENETHVHIEARVNWDESKIPEGAVPNGFVPYLYINAKVINQKTGMSTFIDMLPHINLIDNFHYARNISLPGDINDLYTVVFNVVSPSKFDLALHHDWLMKHGDKLFSDKVFKYNDVDFSAIAKASRK